MEKIGDRRSLPVPGANSEYLNGISIVRKTKIELCNGFVSIASIRSTLEVQQVQGYSEVFYGFLIYRASGERSPRVLRSKTLIALNADRASSPNSERESIVSCTR